jgi:hypothetical protein
MESRCKWLAYYWNYENKNILSKSRCRISAHKIIVDVG